MVYENEKEMTLKEMLASKRIKFMRDIEYGDYDCWERVVVEDLKVALKYCTEYEVEGVKYYRVCIETTFKYLSHINKYGYEEAKLERCYTDYTVNDLSEVENIKFDKIVGTFDE